MAMQRNCANGWCKTSFEITDDDLFFYDKVSPMIAGKKYVIPPPTLCPDCRQQRRLTWRNERTLHKDECDLCKKSIVSMYAPDSPHIVYCYDCWWGDDWDPFQHGRDMDFHRPFFDQLHDLRLSVPRVYLFNLHSENSIYTTHSANNKNCYMGVAFGKCEDCYYGRWVLESKNVIDALYCEHCERCYEVAYCLQCYEVLHSQHCQSTRNAMLCYECKDCRQCIGCAQLRSKELYILNKPVTQKEFDRTWKALLSDAKAFKRMQTEFLKLKLNLPHRYALQINCIDSTGDDLYNCKNAMHGFNCRDVEDCKYMFDLGRNKDGMDCYEHGWLVLSELNYELHGGMAGYHLLFCHICAEGQDLSYCDSCFNHCSNLFGCISLKHKSYCILNKQYTQEEYEALVPKIIEHMKTTGEWGEFISSRYSIFAYNESVAPEYFPASKTEVLQRGWRWSKHEQPPPQAEKTIPSSKLPDTIEGIPDDILHWAITCEATGRPFKLIKQELDFYRSMKIPVPRLHPDERHRRRMALRNPRKLWNRNCSKCKKTIQTTYSPDRPEIVYCESCYLATVY